MVSAHGYRLPVDRQCDSFHLAIIRIGLQNVKVITGRKHTVHTFVFTDCQARDRNGLR